MTLHVRERRRTQSLHLYAYKVSKVITNVDEKISVDNMYST